MKDQRWANQPDAVAKRPNKRKRLVFVLVAFVLLAGGLFAFERLGGDRVNDSLNPTPGTPEAETEPLSDAISEGVR